PTDTPTPTPEPPTPTPEPPTPTPEPPTPTPEPPTPTPEPPTPTPTETPTPTPTETPMPPISISGAISYCSDPSAGPVSGVTMTLVGTTADSTLSDGAGNYLFSGLPAGGTYTVTPSKSPLLPGALGINTIDIIATQRHFLNITTLSGCRLTAADVNGDS